MSRAACPLGLRMAEELRDCAAAHGMDYVDVAKMFGRRPHYVRRVFNGTVAASLPQLEWFAAMLGYEFPGLLVPIKGRGKSE